MLGLSTRSCSVTIDTVQQKISLVPHPSLFSAAQVKRVVSFDEIEQIYLNFWEDSYFVRHDDEYDTDYEPRIWRRWAIELTLKDGQTVTIGEETSDHRAGETKSLARQRAYWEPLAASVSELIGKPLAAMPGVRDGARTFVQSIDQILQRLLKQSGRNDLSVSIHSGKDLAVEITVNGRSYVAVDEIEDKVVRDLLQRAIEEWQHGRK